MQKTRGDANKHPTNNITQKVKIRADKSDRDGGYTRNIDRAPIWVRPPKNRHYRRDSGCMA
jgi:hypothetical protein